MCKEGRVEIPKGDKTGRDRPSQGLTGGRRNKRLNCLKEGVIKSKSLSFVFERRVDPPTPSSTVSTMRYQLGFVPTGWRARPLDVAVWCGGESRGTFDSCVQTAPLLGYELHRRIAWHTHTAGTRHASIYTRQGTKKKKEKKINNQATQIK